MAKLAPNTIYFWIIIREVWGGKLWPMYHCPASTLFNKYVPTVAVLVVSLSRWQQFYNFNPPACLSPPADIIVQSYCLSGVATIKWQKSKPQSQTKTIKSSQECIRFMYLQIIQILMLSCIWGDTRVKVYTLDCATLAYVTNKMTNNKKQICNIETQKIIQSVGVTKPHMIKVIDRCS